MAQDRPAEGSTRRGFLRRWGGIVAAHPLAVTLIPLLCALLCLPLALDVTDDLSAGGWLPPGSEAVNVDHRLSEEFGRNTTAHYLLFSDSSSTLAYSDTAFQREMARILVQVRDFPGVSAIHTKGTVSNPGFAARLLSTDHRSALAIVLVDQNVKEAAATVASLQRLVTNPVLTVQIGGWPAFTHDFQTLATHDLARAEAIALPICLLLLVAILGRFVLALLPLVTTTLALIPTLAGLAVVSRLMETSVFTMNVVVMIGLALGIDYALILVNRFREERRTASPTVAMQTTIATAGRTVIASGGVVATGLAGLLAFGAPAATATAIAGVLVVGFGVLMSLSVLPGLLMLLGDRASVSSERSIPSWTTLQTLMSRCWASLERHPGRWLTGSVLLLILIALPVSQLQPVMPSMTVIPTSQPSRQMLDHVATDFPEVSLSPIIVVVEPVHGYEMTSRRNLVRLDEMITSLEGLDGVASVTSVWSFLPQQVTPTLLANTLELEPDFVTLAQPYLTTRAAVLEIGITPGVNTEEAEQLVRELRKNGLGLSNGDFTFAVGGEAATGIDVMNHLESRVLPTIGLVVVLAMAVLVLQLRSIVLPVKAILLNMLALAAALGLSVVVFQEGIPFDSGTGSTIVIVPILMFCFMFGLSMDYEVIMLSRIRESWLHHGDNTRAVREGMRATAGIVTSAALIMVVVFGAFGTSELGIIREIGIGLAIAVVLDATIIRLIALPAAVLLMGKWNWWFPAIPALHNRPPRKQSADE